jgi:phosphoglycerate-specific signal transduction histidine kinase
MALSQMLSAQPQTEARPENADPQQALAQLDQLIATLQSVTDEGSYQSVKQQFADMGADMSELPDNYDPAVMEQMVDQLMQLREQIATGGEGQEGEVPNA